MRPIDAPKYQQIADELRRRILDGTYPPGTPFPTQTHLRDEFDVSSRVVVDATKMLVAEGLVDSRPGRVSTVRERPSIVRLARPWYRDRAGHGSPWRAEMAAAGRTGAWTSQSERGYATPAVAERLRIEPGSRVMRTDYIFTADGKPTYLSVSWEPMALTGGTEILLPESGPHAGEGVVDRFAAIGVTVTAVREEPVVPRTLTIDEAKKLGLRAGMQVLLIERTYYAGETPVETADILMPPHYRPVYEIPVG